jgi:hypothetical protein
MDESLGSKRRIDIAAGATVATPPPPLTIVGAVDLMSPVGRGYDVEEGIRRDLLGHCPLFAGRS